MRRTFLARRARLVGAPALVLSALGLSLPALAQPAAAPAPAVPVTPAPQPAQAGPAPVAPPTATIGVRPLTLQDCVAAAIRDNPDSQTEEANVQQAEADRASVRGAFGPKLTADGMVQQWDRPFDLAFGPQTFRVREAFTWTAGATLTQRLSALFTIYDEYKVRDLGVDVATIRRSATRKDIAFRAVEAYYRLLEAERLAAVADASIVQLEAQEKQAQSQFTNGVIGKNDLLRAGLALATARQRAIQMRGQVIVARGVLATVMGRPADESVEAAPFSGDLPPTSESAIQNAEAHAVAQRLEVHELDRAIEQAQSGVASAKTRLFPDIDAVGNYTHVAGSAFQQADSAYVGVSAHWNVWDWGTTLGNIHVADAKVGSAIAARRKIEDQVKLEARKAFIDAQSAREALNVARTAVAQAEENYRIVTKKFEANAATSFDMVDAESLLTQARGQVEQALYDYLIAVAGLQKATGAALPGES